MIYYHVGTLSAKRGGSYFESCLGYIYQVFGEEFQCLSFSGVVHAFVQTTCVQDLKDR